MKLFWTRFSILLGNDKRKSCRLRIHCQLQPGSDRQPGSQPANHHRDRRACLARTRGEGSVFGRLGRNLHSHPHTSSPIRSRQTGLNQLSRQFSRLKPVFNRKTLLTLYLNSMVMKFRAKLLRDNFLMQW